MKVVRKENTYMSKYILNYWTKPEIETAKAHIPSIFKSMEKLN